MKIETKAYIYAVLATLLVAGSFLASKHLSNTINPISLTLYRFVLAALIIFPFVAKDLKKIARLLPKASVVGLFYTLYFLAMFKALETTTILNTGTIYTLVPLITAVLCIFFFGERIPYRQLFVYIVGIFSTLIIIFDADISLLLGLDLNSGDLIFLAGSFSMALYSIVLKILYDQKERVLVLVFATLLAGSLWMLLAMLSLNIPFEWHKIEGELLYSMLYLVIGTTVFTLFLYQKSILILGPKRVMSLVYINPALVAILAFLFEGEIISFGVLFGIIISATATYLILKEKPSKD